MEDLEALLRPLLDVLDYELFQLSGTTVTVATVLIFLLTLGVTLVVSRLAQRALEKFFRMRGVDDVGTLGVARRLLHYAVLLIGLGIGLQTVGINLSALFAAGALFAVAIGFAMQTVAQNFVSGVILLLERTIKPGDVLEVEGDRVKVVEMGIRSTIVRTKDEEDLIVPNSTLVSATVKNYTLRDPLNRVRVTVGVAYSSDMRQARRTLEQAAEGMTWRSPRMQPEVHMDAFGASSVDFEVSVWSEEPWRHQAHSSQLHEAIWWALADQGIEIAFPQLDLHLDPAVVTALERRREG